MNWEDLARALGLVLVIEGLLPFAMPSRWRPVLLRIASMDDREMRLIGLMSMIIGLVMLQALHFFA